MENKGVVMKRMVVFSMMLMLFLSQFAYAGLNERYLLLDAVTSTGAETAFEVRQAYKSWGCDVTIMGSPTAVTVRVEGNQGDAIIYDPGGMAEFVMSSGQLSAGIGTFEIAEHRVKRIRGNLTVLTGGASPTVTLSCIGGD